MDALDIMQKAWTRTAVDIIVAACPNERSLPALEMTARELADNPDSALRAVRQFASSCTDDMTEPVSDMQLRLAELVQHAARTIVAPENLAVFYKTHANVA